MPWQPHPKEALRPVPMAVRARLGNAVRDVLGLTVRAALFAAAAGGTTASLLVGLHVC